jgi:hypothetical protein
MDDIELKSLVDFKNTHLALKQLNMKIDRFNSLHELDKNDKDFKKLQKQKDAIITRFRINPYVEYEEDELFVFKSNNFNQTVNNNKGVKESETSIIKTNMPELELDFSDEDD